MAGQSETQHATPAIANVSFLHVAFDQAQAARAKGFLSSAIALRPRLQAHPGPPMEEHQIHGIDMALASTTQVRLCQHAPDTEDGHPHADRHPEEASAKRTLLTDWTTSPLAGQQ